MPKLQKSTFQRTFLLKKRDPRSVEEIIERLFWKPKNSNLRKASIAKKIWKYTKKHESYKRTLIAKFAEMNNVTIQTIYSILRDMCSVGMLNHNKKEWTISTKFADKFERIAIVYREDVGK